MPEHMPERIMIGLKCLNDYLSCESASAGSPGHLGKKLKGALRRPEIRQEHLDICRNHSDQRDARKVQPLPNHLRAEENIRFAFGERFQYSVVRALSGCGVEVHSQQPGGRKELADFFFDPLRPEPAEMHIGSFAVRTLFRGLLHKSAVVAPEMLLRKMVGERDVAVSAHLDVPA